MRNRLKRLLREAFRQSQEQIPAGFDYLLMISRDYTKADKKSNHKELLRGLTFQEVLESFLSLVKRAGRADV